MYFWLCTVDWSGLDGLVVWSTLMLCSVHTNDKWCVIIYWPNVQVYFKHKQCVFNTFIVLWLFLLSFSFHLLQKLFPVIDLIFFYVILLFLVIFSGKRFCLPGILFFVDKGLIFNQFWQVRSKAVFLRNRNSALDRGWYYVFINFMILGIFLSTRYQFWQPYS